MQHLMTAGTAIVSVMAESELAIMSLMFNCMIRCQRKFELINYIFLHKNSPFKSSKFT